MNRPTIAATIFCGMKVPTHTIYRRTSGVYACASTKERDRSPSRTGNREGMAFVSTTFIRIYDQPSSTGSTATTATTTATATTDRDGYGIGTIVTCIRFSHYRIDARAVVICARARWRVQADGFRTRARRRQTTHATCTNFCITR